MAGTVGDEVDGVNYYEHHLGDWAAATGHLTWDEDMAYTRLLRAYYHTERAIPDGQQYRLAKATTPAQRKAVDTVLAEFFDLRDGAYHQKRADAEIDRYRDKQAKAKRSAEMRWSGQQSQSERNADALTNAMRTHSEGNAHQTPDTRQLRSKATSFVASKPRPAKKAPPDLALSDELKAWAAENAPSVDAAAELEKLKDHTFATARTDWPATVRNWLRKAQEDAQAKAQRGRPAANGHDDEPEWRRIQRERNEAFLGPAAAKRRPTTIDLEDIDAAPRIMG